MLHKIGRLRGGKEFNIKSWVAAFLFGAIIVVMAFFGIAHDNLGDASGGVAAMVNENAISVAEYRTHLENVEQQNRINLSQFPEEARKSITANMRRQALEELIMNELVFQAATKKGVRAADGEVRDTILQYPFLTENGRFQKDRYRMMLQKLNMSPDDFERQVRRQIVAQKLQDLFVGSAAPTQEELRRKRILANQKVSLKYIEVTPEDFRRPGMIDAEQIKTFIGSNMPAIEKYYADHTIEFTQEEKIKARHILVRVDDKRPDTEARKLAATVREQATPANFASLATKFSDDLPTKSKGGDLGTIRRGASLPEFETAAFSLAEGRISDPILTPSGYHVIYVEKKLPSSKQPLKEVESEIARKLLLESKQPELVAKLRTMVEKGQKGEVEAWLGKAGLKWQDSVEFDLSNANIPKLGESQAVLGAVLRKGKSGGFINQLIDNSSGRYVIADIVSWKEAPDLNAEADTEGMDRMVAYRKSSDLIGNWTEEIKAAGSVQRNPRLIQQ